MWHPRELIANPRRRGGESQRRLPAGVFPSFHATKERAVGEADAETTVRLALGVGMLEGVILALAQRRSAEKPLDFNSSGGSDEASRQSFRR